MSKTLIVKISERDNVAIALQDLPAGTQVLPGVFARQDIPQAHKIALTDIPAGGEVLRYGVVLGTVIADTPAGTWINEHSLQLPECHPSPERPVRLPQRHVYL